ncbi:hypothetical protein ATCC90586_011600 [Pythium insidiosum]|nr:hypothetical protein ATCC90586_011600 [Pythium insidiosum]
MRDYLRQRERAGVGALSSGLLVLVIALAESETHMRCLIVNALTTVGEIGAQLPHATRLPLADQQSPVIKTEPRAEPCAPESALSRRPPRGLSSQHAQSRTVEDFIVTELSPKSRAARFAALHQRLAEFNSFHHRVLLEWSTKPSDIDSVHELSSRQTQ